MRGLKHLQDWVEHSLNNSEKTFDEYWTTENELWSLSMEESFRQRDQRLKKLKGLTKAPKQLPCSPNKKDYE